ncbi:hypothetical protein Tco_0280978 [Tanacetum coccineum]
MFLYVDQLQNQLDKDEFQEDKSMAAFWVLNNQFQKFIDWQYFLDYDSEITKKFFAEYTGIKIKQFRETLLLHMGNVKKSVAERTRHKRHGTKSDEHITSSNSRTYITHVVDADIKQANDQVPFAENQSKSVKEASNEAKLKNDIDVVETINIELEHKVAKLLKENEDFEKHYKDIVLQPPSPTPNVPPTKNDLDTLFCPMFDEYFNPSPSVVQPVLVAAIQEVVSTGTPSSTSINQDTPYTSTSQTIQEAQSHVIPTSVEEDDHGIEVAHMDNDL